MPRLELALLATLCVAWVGCGGSDSQGLADPFTEMPAIESSAVTCVRPTAGMVITSNTTLCSGNFTMNTPGGSAAVTIGANNITVTCSGTMLVGPGPSGTSSPNVGFSVAGRSGVSLVGCGAKRFQYGAVVKNSSAVTLNGVHFDDNFTDPNADWVQDAVQGGGLRLEGVTSSTVQNGSFARNWNGVELRASTGVTVTNNVADHGTNWGALLALSNNNTISNNDFSSTYRGGLTYPTAWYNMDTKDSAAVVVDAGSTGNVIQNNNVKFSGDGIFIRAVIGACATGNRVVGNDASYSPHNGIESWCDGGLFQNNTASFCDYGLWLGASDAVTVVGNTADGNKTDGISTQNGEDRHSLLQDNVLTNNGRAGLFLAGANFQNSNPPVSDGQVWNSSHLLVQRNRFSGNAFYDIYLAYSRSVILASNNYTSSKVFVDPATTSVVPRLGSFSGASGRTPPTARLAMPGPVHIGTATTFDASASTPSPSGGTLSFTWLIQSAGARFPGAMPPMVFGGSAGSRKTVTFTTPGFYDVDVTATDGWLGSLATRAIAVVPGGVRVGQTASTWAANCQPDDTTCFGTTFADDPSGVEGSAGHMVTNAAFNMGMFTPAARNLGLNASAYTKLGFFIKANNPHGWQTGAPHAQLPAVILGNPSGTLIYEPTSTVLPNTGDGWVFLEIPLAPGAGSGWTLSNAGGTLSRVDSVEIQADTWDSGFEIWVDALSFY